MFKIRDGPSLGIYIVVNPSTVILVDRNLEVQDTAQYCQVGSYGVM